MSNRITFKAADVRRVVEHSIAAPRQAAKAFTREPVTRPAVILVHDQGVYLMSNGEPRDIIEGSRSHVAHAEGCDPRADAGWWERSRELVGGDDFGEVLEWAEEIRDILDAGADRIEIDATPEALELVYSAPPRRRPH